MGSLFLLWIGIGWGQRKLDLALPIQVGHLLDDIADGIFGGHCHVHNKECSLDPGPEDCSGLGSGHGLSAKAAVALRDNGTLHPCANVKVARSLR